MKILFICNQGQHRSPTARDLWMKKHPDDEARSKGVFVDTNLKESFKWADKIIVMEDFQLKEIIKIDDSIETYKKIICLDIPDCIIMVMRS